MAQSICRVLVTGANGFIGKNLVMRLRELHRFTVVPFLREDDPATFPALVAQVDAVIHLAGENRPLDEAAFAEVNTGLTEALASAIRNEAVKAGRQVTLVLASSTQATLDNPYGRSKLAAEVAVRALAADTGNAAVIFRLPGVFGKWCRPNYNSVVATFCHKIARDQPIQVNDPTATLRLVYVDDVVSAMIDALHSTNLGLSEGRIQPEYTITLGELADQIRAFERCRNSLVSERVGTGLVRALYATYISYLPNERFSYELPQYGDPRGIFVEFLKTRDSGQFSFFTSYPGVTRGGHYHHTKSEKFLVIKGEALFRFRHLITNEVLELRTSGDRSVVVDSIPGWSHDITNVGTAEMLVMLWANENFDRDRPDTVASMV